MPEEWRKAFNLHHRDRLSLQELGEVLDKNTAEIEDMLDYARRHLREKLMAAGCTFILKGSESPAAKTNTGA